MTSSQSLTIVPHLSLRQTEARERASLIEVTSYDVHLDLDRGDETFLAVSRIELVSQGGPTFVEVQPVELVSVTVNGRAVDVGLLDRGRLPIQTEAGDNVVAVESVMAYRRDGEGMHRAADPADNLHYLYAMPFLDAGPSIFACFDQPDLKAVWTFTVHAPAGWTVHGNTPATEVEAGHWRLGPTLPLATYHVTIVAGPYHMVRSAHDGIPLSLSARASLAAHLDRDADEIFTLTSQCLDEYHRLFGTRYPFGDYHQAFVPEFNAGAMESPGCVLVRDSMVFESREVRRRHLFRAITIAHEMAHMWFGDTVTPVWWDDLWLNESFAQYLGTRVTADVTEFADAWVWECYLKRSWGLSADQRPSTHPVAGNGAADAAAAMQNFDGISYDKGTSMIKQLNSRLGDEVLLGGLRDHFERHRFGNATMADLMESWERAGAGDLSDFSDGWLLSAGPDTIELDRAAGVVRRTPLAGHPADRTHALGIATASVDRPGAWSVERLVLDAAVVEVAVPAGPVVLDPHMETWAVALLDEATLAALPDVLPATRDPLLRASAWSAVRNGLQHARLDPDAVLGLLEQALPHEDTDNGVGATLAWAALELVPVCVDPAAAEARVHDVAAACVAAAEAGSSRQLEAFQVRVAAASTLARLRAWLDGDVPDGIVVDLDLRWRILRSLARHGAVTRDELAETLAAETTAVSQVEHARAVASLPDAQAKAWAWRRFTGEVEVTNHELEAIGLGLWQVGQEHLTDPYVDRYFQDVARAAEVRSGYLLSLVTGFFYPLWSITEDTVRRAHNLLARDDLDPTIRRAVVDETWDLERRLAVVDTFRG